MMKIDWDHINDLARKSLDGDQSSYREFLEQIRSYVQIKVNKTIPQSNRDDVIQEILLGIHKSLKTLDLSRSCKAWVNAIAHYKVSDHLREIYKNCNLEQMDDELGNEDPDLLESKQYVEFATSVLNMKEKNILLKLKMEGYSISEVASETGLSESNIKVITFRAIKKVREFVNDEEFDEGL